MGLVQEMAPVVKTLQEREATLLNVRDNDFLPTDGESDVEDEEPPSKRTKANETSDKEPSSDKMAVSATTTKSKVDSLVSEVMED